MRNCIVLSGNYRSFDQTYQNIQKFIEINSMDVYCHLWSVDEIEISNVKERLNPKKFMSEDFDWYKEYFTNISDNITKNNPKPSTMDNLVNHASMNFGRNQAYKLIEGEYDNLVYCRYDIDFLNLFTFSNLTSLITPLEQSYNIISDIFALIPFDLSKHYFIFDVFELLHSSPFEENFESYLRNDKKYGEENIRIHKEERYCPHMILLRNIINHGVPQEHAELPVTLKR